MNIKRYKLEDIDFNRLFGEIVRNKTNLLGADVIYLPNYKRIIFEFKETKEIQTKTIEQWSDSLS